jgi:hypothetical protein
MDYNKMRKAYRLWDNQSRQIIEQKDVLFDKLRMEGGDRCETSLDNTIMHINDIGLDAPIPRAQYPMEGEGAHKMGDAQLLVEKWESQLKAYNNLFYLTPLI